MHITVLLFTFVSATLGYEVELTTNFGKVGGFKYLTTSKTLSDVVLNIPYAKPPIGELRWEKPVFPEKWDGMRNGTAFGHQCIPHMKNSALPTSLFGQLDEDCLTLNVIRPTSELPKGGFPILVYIHEGGFVKGSAAYAGYTGFANIYNPAEIMVVTIQYRVGVYGFLSTGEKEFAGNYGMFDMALALRFISENAVHWGGNAKSITVWGQSIGSAAAGALSVSPYSRDFVSGTIQMSGSLQAHWAHATHQTRHTQALAQELGCPIKGVPSKDCLKMKSVEEIFAAVNKTKATSSDWHYNKYAPVIDGDFFPKSTLELVREFGGKPAIIGVASKETAYFTFMSKGTNIQPFSVPDNLWSTYNRDSLVNTIKNSIIRKDMFGAKTEVALNATIDQYVNKLSKPNDAFDYYLSQLTDLLSALNFYVPCYEEVQSRLEAGADVYLYRFDHYNEAIFPNPLTTNIMKGSPHTNEHVYMFEQSQLAKFSMDTKDEQTVKDIVQQSIISFAKNKIPKTAHAEWPKTTKTDMEFLKIAPHPEMDSHFYEETATFWHKIRSFGYDMIKDRAATIKTIAETFLTTRRPVEN